MSWTLPIKTEWQKEQMAHEPTRVYAENIYKIAKQFGYKKALEVGCMWGISTLAILLADEGTLTSVDKSSYTHAPEEIEANGLSDRWNFINLTSTNYWKGVSDKFDLIYIDGDHHYNHAKEDLFEGWERVNKGGVLVIDDVLHKHNASTNKDESYGVSLAAWELFKAHHVKTGFEGDMLWFKK